MGPLPPPVATIITARRQGPPLGRRARDTWMATLYFVQKTRYLGATLLGTWRAETSTPETRGKAGWSCTLPAARQHCRGADPSLNKQTCSRYASMLRVRQPRALHRSASSQRKSRCRVCTCFWCFRPAPRNYIPTYFADPMSPRFPRNLKSTNLSTTYSSKNRRARLR